MSGSKKVSCSGFKREKGFLEGAFQKVLRTPRWRVSNRELSDFFGPHRVPGRELSEFLSAYYLCAKANSPSFSQNSLSLP